MATDKTTTPDKDGLRYDIKATVIISVYKNIRVLEAVLHSLERQTNQDFEVIISEDGDDKDMETFVRNYPFRWPHLHLTQEDKGWRKERSLNRAVAAAHTDWLIFIDGDCILHPRFVEFHSKYSRKGVILAGKRVKLNEELSEKMLAGKKICFTPYLLNRRGCRYIEEAFFLPAAQCLRRPVKHLLGSNMSMSRSDLMAINGFYEWLQDSLTAQPRRSISYTPQRELERQ